MKIQAFVLAAALLLSCASAASACGSNESVEVELDGHKTTVARIPGGAYTYGADHLLAFSPDGGKLIVVTFLDNAKGIGPDGRVYSDRVGSTVLYDIALSKGGCSASAYEHREESYRGHMAP